MKTIKKILLILFIIVPFVSYAKYDDCTYKYKSEVGQLAKNINAAYEIVEEDGVRYIKVIINNVVNGLVVSYSSTTTGKKSGSSEGSGVIVPYNTENGVYTIRQDDVDNVYKYTFRIAGTEHVCPSYIRSFSLTVPKYNKYSELDECKYYDVSDYIYCQKWITTNFNISEDAVKEKINNQREDAKKKITTKCISCDDIVTVNDKYNRLMKLWKYTIIGLAIGVVVDLILIVFLYKKLKEYLVFDI